MIQKPALDNFRVVHKGWLTVVQKDLKIEGLNEPYPYDIIEITNWVAILPFIDQDTVLLSRQYRVPVGESLLELIQGGINPNEIVPRAAFRELLEETGYTGVLSPLTKIYPLAGSVKTQIDIFSAHHMIQLQCPIYDPLEKMDLVTMPFRQLVHEVIDGRHKDATLSIAVTHYAVKHGIHL